MADVIVNQVSPRSTQYLDYAARDAASPCAGLLLTRQSGFPNGASDAVLARIYRRGPGAPSCGSHRPMAVENCFVLPEIFEFIAESADRVDHVYDFALPPLLLHAFAFRTSKALANWIANRPGRCRQVIRAGASNLDPCQANGSCCDTLGRNDAWHLAAHTVQRFLPSIPRNHQVGMLAELGQPVVKDLCALRKPRKSHAVSPWPDSTST